MLHIRSEGEEVKFGFNFYPFGDKASFGFILKYWKKKGLILRYSKLNRKLYIQRLGE